MVKNVKGHFKMFFNGRIGYTKTIFCTQFTLNFLRCSSSGAKYFKKNRSKYKMLYGHSSRIENEISYMLSSGKNNV